MEKKIAVVVVTYNRLTYLKECLESLRNQTYEPDEILVINNSSTDGTTDWLNEQNDLVIVNQANLGGAGGFYTGIKAAYEQGFEYVWVMDDDVEPELDCLEKLMQAFKDFGDEYDVLLPDRYCDESKSIRWRYGTQFNFSNPFRNYGIGNGISFRDDYSKKILPIVSMTFEGPIFKRKVIEKIGHVEKDFFIILDDTDYSVRIVNAGFKIGVVTNSILLKKIFIDVKKGFRVDFKLYYSVRNNIIIDRKFGNFIFALIRNIRINLKLVMVLIYNDVKRGEMQVFRSFQPIFKGIRDGWKWEI
jgi:GT2 family glycosyltransferase